MTASHPRTFWKETAFWLALPLLIFLVLPVLGLGAALDWTKIGQAIALPSVRSAVAVSLVTTTAATLLSAVLGLPVAWWLASRQRGPWRHLEAIVEFPIILPPAVAGLGLLLALGRNGFLGQWFEGFGWQIPFTTVAVVLAQIFVGAPLFIKHAIAGLRLVPGELREAAEVMGASPLQSLRHVALPIAAPAIAGGLVACWARALGEFGATLLFAGSFPGRTETLPLAIYQLMEHDMQGAIIVSLLLLIVALAVLAGLRMLWHPET